MWSLESWFPGLLLETASASPSPTPQSQGLYSSFPSAPRGDAPEFPSSQGHPGSAWSWQAAEGRRGPKGKHVSEEWTERQTGVGRLSGGWTDGWGEGCLEGQIARQAPAGQPAEDAHLLRLEWPFSASQQVRTYAVAAQLSANRTPPGGEAPFLSASSTRKASLSQASLFPWDTPSGCGALARDREHRTRWQLQGRGPGLQGPRVPPSPDLPWPPRSMPAVLEPTVGPLLTLGCPGPFRPQPLPPCVGKAACGPHVLWGNRARRGRYSW